MAKRTVYTACVYVFQYTKQLIFRWQVPKLDAVVVPVSGGGMLSGICVAVKALKPGIKIYGAEPLKADDCAKSFAAKKRIPLSGVFFFFHRRFSLLSALN